MKPPATVYTPSSRKLFEPKPYEYTSGNVYKINSWGYLRFGPVQLYLSETMANTYVEVRPCDDTFSIRYRNFQIALVDANERILINRRIRKL